MFKKTIIASAVLAASTGLAFANGGTYVPPHHTGTFYVGVAASRDFTHYDANQSLKYDYKFEFEGRKPLLQQQFTTTFTDTHSTHHDFGDEGWDGEIFGGYGMTFQNHYYLGAEIFGSISNNKAEYSSNGRFANTFRVQTNGQLLGIFSITTPYKEQKKLDLEYSYGISLMPGIKISESTLFYGRVGWIRSQFELKDNVSLNPSAIVVAPSPISLFSKNVSMSSICDKTEDGIQLGVGLDAMVMHNVSLRAEYDWNRYGDLSTSSRKNLVVGPVKAGGNTHTFTFTHRVKIDHPTVNQFKLAAIYHFMA